MAERQFGTAAHVEPERGFRRHPHPRHGCRPGRNHEQRDSSHPWQPRSVGGDLRQAGRGGVCELGTGQLGTSALERARGLGAVSVGPGAMPGFYLPADTISVAVRTYWRQWPRPIGR